MNDQLRQLLGQPPAAAIRPDAVGVLPATVVRSDAGGVFVAVLQTATAHALGPCLGATYLRETPVTQTVSGTSVTTWRYLPTPLPIGARVLVANTIAGVWVLAHQLP